MKEWWGIYEQAKLFGDVTVMMMRSWQWLLRSEAPARVSARRYDVDLTSTLSSALATVSVFCITVKAFKLAIRRTHP